MPKIEKPHFWVLGINMDFWRKTVEIEKPKKADLYKFMDFGDLSNSMGYREKWSFSGGSKIVIFWTPKMDAIKSIKIDISPNYDKFIDIIQKCQIW